MRISPPTDANAIILQHYKRIGFLIVVILLVFIFALPARAQTAEPPVVHAAMFWMRGCSHCEYVRANTLPPLQAKYGPAFDLLQIEVSTSADIDLLYAMGDRLGVEHVGVPFLIIGDHVLVGSQQIPEELQGVIEKYLAAGGVPMPVIPELEYFSSMSVPASPSSNAVVHMILFSTLECSSCELTVRQAIAPLQETYAGQLEVDIVDVVTTEDVNHLYQVAAQFGVAQEYVDLPLVIIGEHILIDQDIAVELPALIDKYLAQGGVDFASLPPRGDATVTPAPAAIRSNGFTLAIVIIALMAAALIYSIIAFTLGKAFPLPTWSDWLIPVIIVTGIGMAGYLSYVETQSVEAMCGPVGDCNTVQQSRYARLFGVLPIGVFGLLGYLGLLTAWLVRRFAPKLEKPAAIGFWGMAFFAVIFSLYLTYLEPFVIKAVCLWCLSSSIIATLLLLLGTPPAIRQFLQPDGLVEQELS